MKTKIISNTIKTYLLVLILFIFSCKTDEHEINLNNNSNIGTITFRGMKFNTDCYVYDSYDPAYQWQLSMNDDKNKLYFQMNYFPQHENGKIGFSPRPNTLGFPQRRGLLTFNNNMYNVEYGKIQKLDKYKFTLKGYIMKINGAIQDSVLIEGNIKDTQEKLNIDRNQIPNDLGLVSFTTIEPTAKYDTISVFVRNMSIPNQPQFNIGQLTYQSDNFQCWAGEVFFFLPEGNYQYYLYGKNGGTTAWPFIVKNGICQSIEAKY